MTTESTQRGILSRPNNQHRRFTLHMAPMIDIIFLLLIFFLVATKWRPLESFLPLKIPATEAKNSPLAVIEPLAIHITDTAGGCMVQVDRLKTVQIEDQTIEADMASLMETVRTSITAQKRYASDPVEIVCGPQVKWEHLAKIYNLFFGEGMTDITFTMTQ